MIADAGSADAVSWEPSPTDESVFVIAVGIVGETSRVFARSIALVVVDVAGAEDPIDDAWARELKPMPVSALDTACVMGPLFGIADSVEVGAFCNSVVVWNVNGLREIVV